MNKEPAKKKKCSCCGENKLLNQFHKKTACIDGIDYYCKNCKAGLKMKYLIDKGVAVNETRFNSIINGLTSVSRKVFDAVPVETYWSAARIQSELFRCGSNQTMSVVMGSLKALVDFGLVHEIRKDLFTRVKAPIPKKRSPASEKLIEFQDSATSQQKEEKMINKTSNPFDAVREVAIKFLDAAKTINALAIEIDLKLSDVEKHMAANDQDTAKLKQLQSLLKSLG